MKGKYDAVYERVERHADRGVISSTAYESAKVELLGVIASELARLNETLASFSKNVERDCIAADKGKGV